MVEIFSRLNSRGTRVTEADIYLGVVAARNPCWVRDSFLPYLRVLADAGFDLSPNLLFRTVTGVGEHSTRFKDIPDSFWNPAKIVPAWDRTMAAWKRLVNRLRTYGVLSNDILPTEAALVTMVSMVDRFQDDANFPFAMYWFLQASRFGRYSGSSTTSLNEDLRDLNESASLAEGVQRLLRRMRVGDPLLPEDFLRDYIDSRFGRLLLYLLVYQNQALDWDEHGHRLGFEGAEVLAEFRPQWHHIFPKKYMEGHANGGLIDSLANIAVIGPSTNIRISARSPMDYVHRYQISPAKLEQQYIDPAFAVVSADHFEDWLTHRASVLADAANSFLQSLTEGL